MKRITSIILTMLVLVSIFGTFTISASAASPSYSVTVKTGIYYTISNLASGKMLNVYGSRSANNTNITVYQNDGTSGQKFYFVKSGTNYVIVPKCATNKAVNVYGSTAKANSNVCIWSQSGNNTQAWKIEYNPTLNGYIIRSANNTNYVLAATGKSNSSNVCLKKYNPNDSYQVWSCNGFSVSLNRNPSSGNTDSNSKFVLKNHLQVDQPWSSVSYGSGSKASLRDSGCGILSIVNAVYNLNGKYIAPTTVASWAHSKGLYNKTGCEGCYGDPNDRSSNVFYHAAKKFGATYGFDVIGSYYGKATDSRLKNHIMNGGTAIIHVPGHFMTIVAYDSATGKYLVFDSAPGSGTSWNSINRRNLTSPNGDWKTPAQLSSGNLKIDRYYLFSGK